MENRSTRHHPPIIVIPDGSKDRDSPEDCGADEFREGSGILPGDVARRVFGSNPERAESLEAGRIEIAKTQRQIIAAADLLPLVPYHGNIDAKGTEHAVRFRGVQLSTRMLMGSSGEVSSCFHESWASMDLTDRP